MAVEPVLCFSLAKRLAESVLYKAISPDHILAKARTGHDSPSTTLSGVALKIDGVIHGSRTNQPPWKLMSVHQAPAIEFVAILTRLTPRTFSLPKLNFSVSCRFKTLTGKALPTAASSAAAASADLEIGKIMLMTRTTDLVLCV